MRALGLLMVCSFCFLFIYPKGGYQFKDAIRKRIKFVGSGVTHSGVSKHIELHIGNRLGMGGKRKQSFDLTGSDFARTLHRSLLRKFGF